jgi:Icc-related predicted phosphoesterase
MKLQLMSDLHLEFGLFEHAHCGADIIVLAGDIHTRVAGIEWAKEAYPDTQIIYVLGNHEYWKRAYPKFISEAKSAAKGSNIHVLEKDKITIDGVNFFGLTLWTNFEIFGDPRIAGYECQSLMKDYKKIRRSPTYSKLRSVDTATIHAQSIVWLREQLEMHSGESNVVVTHHAPSILSIPPNKRDEQTVPAYASNLESFIIETSPTIWLHGHLHNSSNYQVGNCKVLSNPRGYPGGLNPCFDPRFCVEIDA